MTRPFGEELSEEPFQLFEDRAYAVDQMVGDERSKSHLRAPILRAVQKYVAGKAVFHLKVKLRRVGESEARDLNLIFERLVERGAVHFDFENVSLPIAAEHAENFLLRLWHEQGGPDDHSVLVEVPEAMKNRQPFNLWPPRGQLRIDSLVRLVVADDLVDRMAVWDWVQHAPEEIPPNLPIRDQSIKLRLAVRHWEVVPATRFEPLSGDGLEYGVIQGRPEIVDDLSHNHGYDWWHEWLKGRSDFPLSVTVDTDYGLGIVLDPVVDYRIEFANVTPCAVDLGRDASYRAVPATGGGHGVGLISERGQ